jgi:hypothetical protein
MRQLLPLVLVLASSSANAAGFEADLRAGLASPGGDGVLAGPAFGLVGRANITARYNVFLSLDRSLHSLASGVGHIDATTAALGVELVLDVVPVVPTLSLGPALQLAQRRENGALAWTPTGTLSLGLRTQCFEQLVLAVNVLYLAGSFTSESFPAFTSFFLELGWKL